MRATFLKAATFYYFRGGGVIISPELDQKCFVGLWGGRFNDALQIP